MGILGSLFRRDRKTPKPSGLSFAVDLTRFRCNASSLAEVPGPEDGYYNLFDAGGAFYDPSAGIELGVSGARLDYIHIALGQFAGDILADGRTIEVGANSREADIASLFGPPYWRDDDDDEVILFYEDGRVELQFEFPEKLTLGFITMSITPIMANAKQREAYGVSRSWPPTGPIFVNA